MAIIFPTDPTTGQLYIGDNSVTYQWMGTHWSSVNPALHGFSQTVYEGGQANQTYNELTDNTIEGGGA